VNSVFFVALRRLRAPLILLIAIFAIATVGLTLIPGVDEQGREWRMTIFQAFYFVTYTATTIGFGEIPHAFTDIQRLWVLVVIYMSVIGWSFLLGALLALAQDKGFQHAIVTARFRRAVQRLREPFFIICGLGETGLMVVRSLDRLGFRFVVIDTDAVRLSDLELQELGADALDMHADARSPETLTMAGMLKSECRGLLALSNNDDANLAIAINARLLNPRLRVICRCHTPAVSASMETIGTYQVINPYTEFGEHLLLAMRAADSHRLLSWLAGPPGSYLQPRVPAPPGGWIVCGYGRFGAEVVSAIQRGGFDVTIIDPTGGGRPGARGVRGVGTDASVLREAGIADAAGLVAGTDNDTTNLTIALAARHLNPRLFIIVRQNLVANKTLFDALGANMTMVSSQIIANECVAILRTPLLAEFLRIVRAKDDVWAHAVVERLRAIVGDVTPDFWSFVISPEQTPGLCAAMGVMSRPVTVGDLRRSLTDRTKPGLASALLIERNGRWIELPDEAEPVQDGDHFLFAGTADAKRDQRDVLRNADMAAYVIAGRGSLGGTLWHWLAGPRRPA